MKCSHEKTETHDFTSSKPLVRAMLKEWALIKREKTRWEGQDAERMMSIDLCKETYSF